MEYTFHALGTTWWIEIFHELTPVKSADIQQAVSTLVTNYERDYSRFIVDSDISTLNQERSLSNPSLELLQLLTYGKQLYLRTDTTFNLLTGHLLEARGYDASYSFKDTETGASAGNPITDLTLEPNQITLTQGNIDIGGFGKGYLIDKIAQLFASNFGLEEFFINGGGDMYATHQNNQPITIYLEHPTIPGVMVGSTPLLHQGFAASSPHKRVWTNASGTHHHIIADILTSDATFVKAASAADADAFATTALQLDQSQLNQLVHSENLAVAQYTVTTKILSSTSNFL